MKAQKNQRVFSILTILVMVVIITCIFTACDKGSQNQELSANEIYSNVDPSVAFILISTKSGYSSGSGFFIDNNGTLVTNYHVIEDGLSGAIQMNDGKTATIDKVLGFDKKLDIAILATSATNTKPVTISKTPVQVGDTVYAIGYPEAFKLGFSSSTFTTGMVSMNRSIDGYTYIQSTVDITHGNSGGALINKYGEIVGITTAGITYSNIDYMNLSIPIQRIDTISRNVNDPLDVVTKRNYPVYATFYSDGTKYTSQSVRYEGYAYEPTAPTKTGYSFAGWYADGSFNTKFNFNTKLTSNVSIYAKWNINTYNINYNLNSGTWNGSSPSKTYTINDCEKTLPTPVRTGYIFEGWKNASGDYVGKLPTSKYLGDLSLTASWVEGTEGLTFITRHSGTVYVIVTGYTGNSADVVIPKTYRGVPVECISASAFRNQTQIRSISLPDSLTSIESNAFAGCTGLTSIVIPDKVTSVNSTAFSGCINIATVSMPASIRNYIPNVKNVTITSGSTIQTSAFENCTTLLSVTLPDSLVSIGNNAFYGCTNLNGLNIPSNVTSIGANAFYNCTSISTIVLPDSISSLDSTAFIDCSNIKSVSLSATFISLIPKTNLQEVTITSGQSIPRRAFYNCAQLSKVVLPETISEIGNNAFYGCSKLSIVEWNAIECNIAGSETYPIFSNCSNLSNVVFGTKVKIIPSYAFYGCDRLSSINITGSVESIGYRSFYGCSNLEKIEVDAENSYYSGFNNCLVNIANKTLVLGCKNSVIPSDGNVISIGEYAFFKCIGLKNITIPGTVSIIGNYAFSDCSSLNRVTIENGTTSIGQNAFLNCTYLNTITLPESIRQIGSDAFNNCGRIIAVNISDISNWCAISFGNSNSNPSGKLCYNGEYLNALIIPASVSSISSYAFYGHTELKSITVPESITAIGESAFEQCSGLNAVNISSTDRWCGITFGNSSANPLRYANNLYCNGELVTKLSTSSNTSKIGQYAFYNYTKLTNIDISSDVKTVGEQAFYNCTGLTSILIPSFKYSILTYGFSSTAFEKCSNLSSITAPVPWASNIALNCGSRSYDIVINGGYAIASKAFYNCYALKSVVISNTVSSIGKNAFSGCYNISKIIVPKSVTSIGKGAFSGCSSLESISIPFVGAKAGVTSSNTYQYPFGYIFGESYASNAVEQRYYGTSLSQTTSSKYAIPASLKEVSVTGGSILRGAFYNCKNLTSVTLYDGVSSIGDYAFYLCNGLTDFSFAQSIKSIGESAFYGCSFTSISIPRNVSNIGIGAFSECNKIESVTIPFVGLNETSPNSYERVFGAIFGIKATTGSASSNIANATCQGRLYDAVNKAYNYYWYKIPNTLKSITITDGAEVIPANAFYNCALITSFNIPSSIKTIGSLAFYACSGLTSFTVPTDTNEILTCAFQNCTGLKNVSFNSNLKRIQGDAFKGCSALSSVSISNISDWCSISFSNDYSNPLYYTKELLIDGERPHGDIVITDGAISIPAYTFYNCDTLTSIVIPNSVLSISSGAFYGCSNLQEMTIPFVGAKANYSNNDKYLYPFGYIFGASPYTNSIETVQGYQYRSSTTLSETSTTYYLPATLTTVTITGNHLVYGAFCNCKNITNIYLSEGISAINATAFIYCSSLTSIVLPNSVTSIGKRAFDGCSGLKEITISENLTYVGDYAFSSCSSLNIVDVQNIEKWSAIDFNTSNTNPLFYSHTLYVKGKLITELTIPEGVITIGKYSFYGCRNITSIVIADSVTSINEWAFSGCDDLTSVTIGKAVQKIADHAFTGCTSLVEVFNKSSLNIVAGKSDHGNVAYYAKNVYTKEGDGNLSTDSNGFIIYTDDKECSLIAYRGNDINLVVPNGITAINDRALYNDTNIVSVTLPDSVTTIGQSAFLNCSNLQTVNFGNGVISIQFAAFMNCVALTSINLPESVTTIGGSAFYGCNKISDISFGSNITNIGENALLGPIWYNNQPDGIVYAGSVVYKYKGTMPSDTTITLKEGTLGVAAYAFSKRDTLTKVILPESVKSIGERAFQYCTKLTNIQFPSNLVSIGNCAFEGCKWLNISSIPDSVVTIGNYAFSGCTSLNDSFTIGINVTSIGEGAFYKCSSLRTLYISTNITSIGSDSFYSSGLAFVNYSGTKEQWNAVNKGANWSASTVSNVYVYCSDGYIY